MIGHIPRSVRSPVGGICVITRIIRITPQIMPLINTGRGSKCDVLDVERGEYILMCAEFVSVVNRYRILVSWGRDRNRRQEIILCASCAVDF